MTKTEFVKARIEPDLKTQGEAILSAIGINTTDAITMFFRQVVMQRGLPFDAKIPTAETIAAVEELRDPATREKLKSFNSVEALMKDLYS